MASKALSSRTSRPLGASQFNILGKRFEDFPVTALDPRAPWAFTCLDFGKTNCVNATAFATLGWTVTDINTATSPTLVADSGNGYLLVNPGSKADSGYGLQANVANVVSRDVMRFMATPNVTMNAGREIVWGIRMGLQNTSASTWDSKWFVGLSLTDTALMTGSTGALDGVTDCIGFHCGEDGVIKLVAYEATPGTETLTMTGYTPATLGGGTISTTLAYDDFHDFVFYAKWNAAAGTTGTDIVEAYIDGKYIGRITGTTILPDLTTISLYNTIEAINGPAEDMDMGVVAIWNGTKRYAQNQI